MTTLEKQTGISRTRRRAGMGPRHFLVFAAAFALGWAFYFDLAVVSWMRDNETPFVMNFMRAVSKWGDWPTHCALGLIGVLTAYALGNRAWTAVCVAMLIALLLGSTANRVIKIAAGRSRPSVTEDAGWKGLRWTSKYNSFPSGHTASSTSFFATLYFARRRIGRWLLVIPALIAFSRMYVGAHYLSDVVFGATIGVVTAWLTWGFVSKRLEVRRT